MAETWFHLREPQLKPQNWYWNSVDNCLERKSLKTVETAKKIYIYTLKLP